MKRIKKTIKIRQLKAELYAYKRECGRLTKMLSDNLDAEMLESRSLKVAEKPQTIEDINYAIRDKEH